MPIRPENRLRYPKDWKAISLEVREAAGWRCEGSPAYPDCRAANGESHPHSGSKVVLTVAHLDHVPENCGATGDRPNLKAWCQRCHNTYDMPKRRAGIAERAKAKCADGDLLAFVGVQRGAREVTLLPRGPFACILADPPWSFLTYGKTRTTPHRTAVDHYEVMTAEGLRALDVGGSAMKDCALLMWVVDSHLDEAIELGKAWGFQFKTIAFIWCKTTQRTKQFGFFPPETVHRIGMGYWTRKQAEVCLLFTRGKPKRLSKGVRQIIEGPRREHSRKPDEQYPRIEALVAGPYLELFARQARPGWESWGNQTDKFSA